jgi:putative ATP-dependent endonuclease of OLD family
MRISKVIISNYRNLDGIEVTFNPKINFIIGQNELGKSNLLDLFEILFNRRQFSEEDFEKTDSSIQIDFSLCLSKAEKGTFDDYFDPNNNDVINITAIQNYSDFDEDIRFFWGEAIRLERRIEIPRSLFRKINYIAYDSLKAPQHELTFHRGRGSGKFLSYLISEFDPEIQIDIEGSMSSVIESIQSVFDRVKPLRQQGLGVYTDEENSSDFVSRVLKLSGSDGFDIHKSGFGIQFSSLLLLSILEHLVRLKRNKRFKQFEERRVYFTKEEYEVFHEMHMREQIVVKQILEPITRVQDDRYYFDIDKLSKDNKEELGEEIIEHILTRKSISLILGLDEPEIHLHPYMQRNLIKYIRELIQNQDVDFLFLLKRHFDIDAIDGQLLIVSHSPSILFNRYEHIVRFYKVSKVNVVNGSSLSLKPQIEKHLLLNFPYIKEAFFSKCVILVEGETETGALPLWAKKIIGDLDEYGITIISVGGCESIPPVVDLLNHFEIPNVSIIDKDDDNHKDPNYTAIDGLHTTTYRDFEEDFFETVYSNDPKVTILFDFFEYYGSRGLSRFASSERLDNIASKYKIERTWGTTKRRYTFKEVKDSEDKNLLKAMFLSWFTGSKTGKSITVGRALGQFISKKFVPPVYRRLFDDAKNKATMI